LGELRDRFLLGVGAVVDIVVARSSRWSLALKESCGHAKKAVKG
jgi:hypothetical protein